MSFVRRHLFTLFFLLVQVLFLVLLIVGLSGHAPDTAAQAVASCNHGQWKGLYNSYHQCVNSLGGAYAGASDAGSALAGGLVIGLWVAVDVILGVGRAIVYMARRSRRGPANS